MIGNSKTNVQTNRYLDVMTIRPSQGTFSRESSHQKLLVSPILIPQMNHISVDEIIDTNESCLFYATGKKNMTMSKQIVNTVRALNQLPKIKHKRYKHKILDRPVIDELVPKPKTDLFFSKDGKDDYNIKSILHGLRKSEIQLESAVKPKIGK